MIDASVVIPITTSSQFLWLLNTVCLRTCRATTNAEILVLDNNSPDSKWKESIQKQCEMLGIRYHYEPGIFSMSRFWNLGTKMTGGKYIAYANADMIFYPQWLKHLTEALEENPDHLFISPWSFHESPLGLGYQQRVEYGKQLITTHWISSGPITFRRADNYEFDEKFQDWEMDVDFHKYAESKHLKVGICMKSRVDHFISAVRDNVSITENYGDKNYQAKASAYLKQKWGLK